MAERVLLLATTSADKLREMRQILDHLPITILTLGDLGLRLAVEEPGRTFRENAALKARAYHAASRLPTLAEDSGLEVDALGGAPGVRSARWEGDDYDRKNRLLIERLAGAPPRARVCRYVCEMALLDLDGRLHRARGAVQGQIADEPLGHGGFGYDPVFYLPRLRRTMAQLDEEGKNAISHRGRALRKLLPTIKCKCVVLAER